MPEIDEEPKTAIIPPVRGQFPVWDKAGKKHMVDHLNVHDMVVNLGYTQKDPNQPAGDPPVQGVREGDVTLFPVWDPRGNKHMVDELNAKDMVEKLGWSNKAPLQVGAPGSAIPEPPPSETALPRPALVPPVTPGTPLEDKQHTAKDVRDLEPGTSLEAVAATTQKGEKVELTSLSVEGLRAYAATNLGMNFDASVTHADMLASILAELESDE